MGEALERNQALAALQEDAYQAAMQVVVKLMHVGGCPRDYTALCPKGWTEAANGDCLPPAGSSLCGRTRMASMTAVEKEQFAVECKASWECTRGCKVTTAHCPVSW